MRGDRKYLRPAEIAALTGMSLRTIRRWVKDEVIPSVKVGGARLVAAADLKALLSASCDTVQETSDDPEEYSDKSVL